MASRGLLTHKPANRTVTIGYTVCSTPIEHSEAHVCDYFGETNPRQMPIHLFWGAKHLDYSTAVRASILKQNFTICPRHWYIDATFHCSRCGESFVFTAEEQKYWYEELSFWIDSLPKECASCRRELRELKALQQEYDRDIAAALLKSTDTVEKRRLVLLIEAMETGGLALADKVQENHRILLSQIAKSQGTNEV